MLRSTDCTVRSNSLGHLRLRHMQLWTTLIGCLSLLCLSCLDCCLGLGLSLLCRLFGLLLGLLGSLLGLLSCLLRCLLLLLGSLLGFRSTLLCCFLNFGSSLCSLGLHGFGFLRSGSSLSFHFGFHCLGHLLHVLSHRLRSFLSSVGRCSSRSRFGTWHRCCCHLRSSSFPLRESSLGLGLRCFLRFLCRLLRLLALLLHLRQCLVHFSCEFRSCVGRCSRFGCRHHRCRCVASSASFAGCPALLPSLSLLLSDGCIRRGVSLLGSIQLFLCLCDRRLRLKD